MEILKCQADLGSVEPNPISIYLSGLGKALLSSLQTKLPTLNV